MKSQISDENSLRQNESFPVGTWLVKVTLGVHDIIKLLQTAQSDSERLRTTLGDLRLGFDENLRRIQNLMTPALSMYRPVSTRHVLYMLVHVYTLESSVNMRVYTCVDMCSYGRMHRDL